MSGESINRRDFMQGSGAAAALMRSWPAVLAAAQTARAAHAEGVPFKTLTVAEARELEAVAARILPTTDTPGAREAGVVHFFDNLPGDLAGMLDGIRGTMTPFETGIGERFPGAARFSDLEEADQDAWLEERQDTPFFGMVRALTLMGFFAMSHHGGNRDNLSWKLIGFDGPRPAQPPFGYYDAEYMREQRDAD